MDDQSIWKKELSFGRKAKDDGEPVNPPDSVDAQEDPSVSDTETRAKDSLWKQELSFSRKGKKDSARDDAPADEAVPVEPDPDPETVSEETVWKKEVSFSRAEETEPVAEEELVSEEPVSVEAVSQEPVVEEAVVEEPAAAEPVVEEDAVAEPVAVEEPVADAPVAEEPVAEEPVREEETAVAEPVAVEEPVADAPVVDEPAAEEPVAEEEVAVAEPVAVEEPVADAPVQVATESWSAKPTQRPVQVDQAATASMVVPEPTPVFHPPVPEEELPPAAAEKKVPFWKKDISFGGKKTREPDEIAEAPTASIAVPEPAPGVHPPVPAAELVPAAEKKVPFWKKDISLGGKKREAPKAERARKEPKASKEPKEPKQPKERKPKKVKAERGAKGAKRIVGLKIGASQLAAARVSNNGSAELQQVAREPLAAGIVVGGELRDPDALAEALKEFFTKHNLPTRGVRLGIANNRIGVRTFDLAGIPDPKQLGNAVRFRAQEALPIPIDEAVLDWQVLGDGVDEEGQPTQRILLVVAYRELIDRYVDACKKAGITLSGIDLEAFALLRALQAPQDGAGNDPTAAFVAVAIGHDRSTFAVSNGRVCEFTRVLEWGGSALNVALARVLNAAPSEVEGVKHELTLTDSTIPEGLTADQATKAVEAMRKAIQTFARELVSSLQYYQNQPGSLGIGEIVLTGGTAHLPGIAGELERLIGVRVRVGDPLARMKVSKKVGDPPQVGSLAVAIGLGIED